MCSWEREREAWRGWIILLSAAGNYSFKLLIAIKKKTAFPVSMSSSRVFPVAACWLKINLRTVTLPSKVATKTTRKPAHSASPRAAEGAERCRNRKPMRRDGCSVSTSIFRLRETSCGGYEEDRPARREIRRGNLSALLCWGWKGEDFDVV